MPRALKRSVSPAVKGGRSRPVEKLPSGPRWLHEIKLDGYRMAARIDKPKR